MARSFMRSITTHHTGSTSGRGEMNEYQVDVVQLAEPDANVIRALVLRDFPDHPWPGPTVTSSHVGVPEQDGRVWKVTVTVRTSREPTD